MARKVTNTWWGKAWLESVELHCSTNSISQARRLARSGFNKFEIDGSTIKARIKGSHFQKYFHIDVKFNEFSRYDINKILLTIKENPIFISALLNNEIPYELHEKLLKKNIDIFPHSFDMNGSCDCHEWDSLCSHKMAVLQYLAFEVDKDPLLVFKLQGCNLLDLLNTDEELNNIKTGEEVFNLYEDTQSDSINSLVDYSGIPDLYNEIFFLLNDDTVFFKKDFKKILGSAYKSFARFVKTDVSNYTRFSEVLSYNSYNPSDKDFGYFEGDLEDYPQWLDETFLKKWHSPNQWGQFKLHINRKYEISHLKTGNRSYIRREIGPDEIFSFFCELSQSSIPRFNPDIQFVNLIYQFSLEIIKKYAFIPELSTSGDKFYIRWIPAVFNRKISSVIDSLTLSCPDNLVKFKNRRISKKSQIIALVNIFIKGFISLYFSKNPPKYLLQDVNKDVFKLFFFDGLKTRNYLSDAKSINQWISKLNLKNDYLDLYFVIEEVDDSFKMDIRVNDELTNIKDFLVDIEDYHVKTEILRDLHVIKEIFPDYFDAVIEGREIILDINEFSDFFINTLPLFELVGINIILPKSLNRQLKPYITLNLYSNPKTLSSLSFEDVIDFDWKVQIGDDKYDLEEFKRIAENSRGLVKFANNYVLLDKNEVSSIINKMDKMPSKIDETDLMHSLLAGEFRDAKVNIDNKLEGLLDDMLKYEPVEVPDSVNAKLRDYQKTGYSWLVQNIKTGFGSILADDMGLGKTLEVLTAVQHLKDESLLDKAKVLIVAPTGLLTNWQKEIEKFTPELSSFIYHGYERSFPEEEYDIYLTSYGIIRSDYEDFNKRKWFLMVVDEAQNIKNPQAKQTKAIKSVKSSNRIAMTGTPVENRLSDYWSIFDFINRGYLTNLSRFRKNYIVPIEKEQNMHVLDNFKKITSPFILRRVKTDKKIIEDLPDKAVNDVYCNMSKKQVSFYKETLDSAMDEIKLNDGIKRKGLVLNLINSLKQICNHPSQFIKSNRYEIEDSGKLITLIDTLENIFEANEKVLIFTQYRQMGNIIKDVIEKTFSSEVLYLHGDISRSRRDEMIEEFQTNSQIKAFVITLKTGGTGLNLTAATNVIHYDLWWNPAVENQATDRAYRIGQSDNVMVYRFITSGTFEEKINEIITKKEDLVNQTVSSGQTFITEMSDSQLKELMMIR